MEEHVKYIKKCFSIAEKAAGFVSPNPLVGAVIVKDDKIIGEGFHQKYGEPHAEVNAINNSKENVAGSTLYCNLEPCVHEKKQTPPCVPFIIENKIKKVVISNLDPNPEVNGKGAEALKKAGIEVITGIMEESGKELNKFYFRHVLKKIPFVTIKLAQSIDGKISLSKKEQTWLTGMESIRFVHELRSRYDAVVVGAKTIRTDNPRLTVREVKGRNPVRIILDGKFLLSHRYTVFETNSNADTWLFVAENFSAKKKIKSFEARGIKVFSLRSDSEGKIDLKEFLKIIGSMKITSVLIEGGQQVASQFIDSDLWDELLIFISPVLLGQGIDTFVLKNSLQLRISEVQKYGNDFLISIKK